MKETQCGRPPEERGPPPGRAPRRLGFGSEAMPGPWRVWAWFRPDPQAGSEWEVRDGDGAGWLFSSGVWLRREEGGTHISRIDIEGK